MFQMPSFAHTQGYTPPLPPNHTHEEPKSKFFPFLDEFLTFFLNRDFKFCRDIGSNNQHYRNRLFCTVVGIISSILNRYSWSLFRHSHFLEPLCYWGASFLDSWRTSHIEKITFKPCLSHVIYKYSQLDLCSGFCKRKTTLQHNLFLNSLNFSQTFAWAYGVLLGNSFFGIGRWLEFSPSFPKKWVLNLFFIESKI